MILVPIKDLSGAKQRLSPVLSQSERTELARAMAEDVFDALVPFASDPGVTIVSGDAWASQQAKIRGFSIILDDAQEGETQAIAMATTFCAQTGCEFTVVFPADIPLITAEEVRVVLQSKPEKGCVIVPAADQRGTNAILRTPADLIPLKFGNDSFQPHLAAARATGFEVELRELHGIALDIDRPDDLAAVTSQPERTRTQRLLREWDVNRRLRSSVHA
jgi:2-phospho-L-lactate guanylyltransferase